jgi:cell division protein FtsQ
VLLQGAVAIAARKPRYAGTVACGVLLLAVAGYGVTKGNHLPTIVHALADARDAAANAAGFRLTGLAIAGRRHLTEAEVLESAGISARNSLLFLDVDTIRHRLEASPWIAQATVRKFYPGRLEIVLEERDPFAIWQTAGKLSVIAGDGAVLGTFQPERTPRLPLVVGPGAGPKARDFLAIIDRYPLVREQMLAAVLVADRRWNLKLKSGLDVRLPETEVEQALDKLVALDRSKKLLSRDLTAIDLRLTDRVTVRLSDEAAQAREEAAKEKEKKKRKGGPA